jgi:5,6-dimethylbenzimidazole synthase
MLDDLELKVFYNTLFSRRDVRSQFSGEEMDKKVLGRILLAAHSAPSVGMSQPWDFVLVTDPDIRSRFKDHVYKEREAYEASLEQDRADNFKRIKIEGIMESSLGVVVTYDPHRGAPSVLGRHAIDDAGLYSVCLAIENLWLAATAEGIGVGWVSFYREEFLGELLGIPKHVRPIAWLCVGPVTHFEKVPDLERFSWQSRRPIEPFLRHNRYESQSDLDQVVYLPKDGFDL